MPEGAHRLLTRPARVNQTDDEDSEGERGKLSVRFGALDTRQSTHAGGWLRQNRSPRADRPLGDR